MAQQGQQGQQIAREPWPARKAVFVKILLCELREAEAESASAGRARYRGTDREADTANAGAYSSLARRWRSSRTLSSFKDAAAFVSTRLTVMARVVDDDGTWSRTNPPDGVLHSPSTT